MRTIPHSLEMIRGDDIRDLDCFHTLYYNKIILGKVNQGKESQSSSHMVQAVEGIQQTFCLSPFSPAQRGDCE